MKNKIAIHYAEGNNLSQKWVDYCVANQIEFEKVNCLDIESIDKIREFNYLLWHVDNYNSMDLAYAFKIIYILNSLGVKTFPTSFDILHFDDKVAQAILLKSFDIKHAETKVFFNYNSAVEFINQSDYPIIGKLRCGSGSNNVFLFDSKREAAKFVENMFNKGVKPLDFYKVFLDRVKNFRNGHETFFGLIKGVYRIFVGTKYSRLAAKEHSYVYFQKFYPKNECDYRIVIIGNKAFGLKRYNKENDFRASGTFRIERDKDSLNLECVKESFIISKKLDSICMAYDFVLDTNGSPILIELSTHFNPRRWINENRMIGFYNDNLEWIESPVLPEVWIIEELLKRN